MNNSSVIPQQFPPPDLLAVQQTPHWSSDNTTKVTKQFRNFTLTVIISMKLQPPHAENHVAILKLTK